MKPSEIALPFRGFHRRVAAEIMVALTANGGPFTHNLIAGHADADKKIAAAAVRAATALIEELQK